MLRNIQWTVLIQQGAETYFLRLLESITIVTSCEVLVDTCVIKLPSSVLNKTAQVEQYCKRGNAITVLAGYDKDIQKEFVGYVQKVNIQNNGIEIQCEDAMYLFRKKVANKQFGASSIKQIAEYIIAQLGLQLTVRCDFDMTYEKYTIHEAMGYDVLKKIQEDTKANIYIKEKTLHIHPAFIEKFGEVAYDMAENVEASDLVFNQTADKKVQIEVTCTNRKGEILKAQVGIEGGEKVSKNVGSQFNQQGLLARANEELKRYSLDSYDGSITAWGVPFVASGYTAQIKDADYPERNGAYYVKTVTTTISSGGIVRKLDMGVRVKSN